MLWRLFAIGVLITFNLRAENLPVVPVGLDAYRQWDKWPQQRIGVRAYMRSTYDRRGRNEGADASHFLYQTADDFNVSLDVEGRGILYFARYNHWHGSPWHYVVDGRDSMVQETSSKDPDHPNPQSIFLPEKSFPNPLTWTWSVTKGADLNWVPIPFEQSFQMAYSRTHYGTGYYIYHQFVEGTPLSQPIRSWNTNQVPDAAVLNLLKQSASELLPAANSREAKKRKMDTETGERAPFLANDQIPIYTAEGAHVIRSIEFTVPKNEAIDFGKCLLTFVWDEHYKHPSVNVPLALFFGAGTLYNRDNRQDFVKAFPLQIRFEGNEVKLTCAFPMRFFKSALCTLYNGKKELSSVKWTVKTEPLHGPANQSAYFHATYQDFPAPEAGKDLVLLDTRKVEGGGDWSGSFVGTSFIFSDRANLTTLEGDPRFFFDDSQTPQAYGTGTEEWGGGGDYWGGRNMTLPFAGHPCGAKSEKEAKNNDDKIESAYRFLLADLMPFGKNAVIRLEHGSENELAEHYQTVTYWYGLPAASLVKTDELKVGNAESEKKHSYSSKDASEPYEITSRYEWGPDSLHGKEIYPTQTDKGRKMTGASEFILELDPKNVGAMLRRKLDYQFPNQRAEVFIADASTRSPKWKKAGTWYLAGGNTCIYSNPRPELGATEHNAQTSNRRFRDDEFLIPRKLTEGKKAVRVKVQFTPVNRPLFPGQSVPELAWSEIRYDAYCFVMPDFKAPR
ncbi:MAG: hypothetical protein JWM68_2803 [Verrucomicrobiales bacterium]|nr:hypothetical protein [Verrucomicrobiales bacterium]